MFIIWKYKISTFNCRVDHPSTTSSSKVISLWRYAYFGFCKLTSKYIWGKKSSWGLDLPGKAFLWGFLSAYVSKCRNITRCHRNMVDSAFKSWWSILSDPNKIFVIRTHPEELHVLKYISSLHICTDFSQQWGQQMLAKCYPTSQGCSYDFQRLKVWPLGVPKPYRTSSYDALSPL